jgi:RNA polymerase sigma-70 factor (ECF subfamily)
LAAVDRLAPELVGYHPFHATRAEMLRRLGRTDEARTAYGDAIALATNAAEIAALTRRRDRLS